MNSLGLHVKFFDGITRVMTAHNEWNDYPVGVLPCKIFQGDMFNALKDVMRKLVYEYPDNDVPYSKKEAEIAQAYVRNRYALNEMRFEYELAISSFVRIMDVISCYGPEDYLTQIQQVYQTGKSIMISVDECVTVGQFLWLCYDYYVLDLINACGAFLALASKQAGESSKEYEQMYSDFQESIMNLPAVEMKLEFAESEQVFDPVYRVTSFESYVALEYTRMHNRTVKFRRCQNPACRKYFVARRSSAMYCDVLWLQDQKKTCREIYPQVVRRDKTNRDEMAKRIRGAQSRLYNIMRRHPEYRKPAGNMLNEIETRRDEMTEKVIAGEETMAEFSEWLDSMNIKNIRKEV